MKICKITLVLLVISLSNFSFAQITATLRQPPPFQFKAADLWRVNLINTGSPAEIYLKAIVTKGTARLIEATSSKFVLPTSLSPKLIDAASISPIDLKKNSSEVDDAFKTTGSLPSGKYNICIYVYSTSNVLLSQYCSDFEVLQTIKGELISPRDMEDIKIPLPIFNWMPPSPITPGNNVTYEINIVEILERQTAIYAMSANPYVFSRSNIANGIFQYPVAALQLENGRRYAWRVKTYLNGSLLSESEVREFSYNGKSISSKDFNSDAKKKFLEESKTFIEMPVALKQMPESGGFGEIYNFKKANIFSPRYFESVNENSKSPFKFSGNYELSGKLSDRQKTGSQIPRNLLSIKFAPTLSVYDIPFTFNFYYDTQQQDFKQNINSFALLFDPAKLKEIVSNKIEEKKNEIEQKFKDKSQEEINKAKDNAGNSISGILKFFSNFKTLGIGETYPSYSRYILNGTKVTGLDLEYTQGLLYLAASGFKNLDAVDSINFARKLWAAKIGIGGKDDSHFHITMMKAKDNINSLDINDTMKVTSIMSPMENVIVGTDGKIKLFKDRVSIKGEVSGSVITDDLRAPDLVSDDIPGIAKDLISIKMGTHYDLMYNIESVINIPESNTKLKGGYKYIGLGYSSLGSPSITNGLKGFNIGIDQYLADKKINVKLSSEFLTSEKTSMDKSKVDFGLSMFFENAPYLILSYTPYSEKNNASVDSLKIENTASAFSLTTGINIPVKNYTLGTMISLSSQSNQSKKRAGDFTIYNFLVNETISFEAAFSITAGMNITAINSYLKDTLSPANTYSYDLSSSLTLFEKWNNTLALSYQKTSGFNSNVVLSLNSSLSISKIGNLSVSLMKNFYREVIFNEGENNDIIFKATLSKSW
ncbi:MAG: hypothetical protein K1X86_14395 [Ignavibacteria bacterium]|nr:hypothetical protein [Ignavibacteria bacterium]